MKTHKIGGSILPSSSPQILRPMPFRGSVLQVVPDYDADTHCLTLDGKAIASHPNGYSCHELGARMIVGDSKRIQDQANYIVDCGGQSDFESMWSVMK